MLPLVIAAGAANIGSTIMGGISRDAQLRVQLQRTRQRQGFMREQYGRNVVQMDQNLANTQSGIAGQSAGIGANRAGAGAGGLMAGITASQYGQSSNMMASRQYNLQKDDMTAQFNQQILESDQQISDMEGAKEANLWQTAMGVGVGTISLGGSIYDAVQKYTASAAKTQSLVSSDPAEADAAAGNLENANVQQEPQGWVPDAATSPQGSQDNQWRPDRSGYRTPTAEDSTSFDIEQGASQKQATIDMAQSEQFQALRSEDPLAVDDRGSQLSNVKPVPDTNYNAGAGDADRASQFQQFKSDAPKSYAELTKPVSPNDDLGVRAEAQARVDKLFADADLKNMQSMVNSGRAKPVFEDGKYKLFDTVTKRTFSAPNISTADAVAIGLSNKFVSKEMAASIGARVNMSFESTGSVDWGLIPPDVRAAVIHEWTIAQADILSIGNRQGSSSNARLPKGEKK